MELFCHRKKGGRFLLEVAELNWPQATTFEKELEVGKEGGGNTVYLGGDLNWAPAVVVPAHTRNPLPIRQNGQKLHHCHGQPGNQHGQLPCNFSWQQHAAGAPALPIRAHHQLSQNRQVAAQRFWSLSLLIRTREVIFYLCYNAFRSTELLFVVDPNTNRQKLCKIQRNQRRQRKKSRKLYTATTATIINKVQKFFDWP